MGAAAVANRGRSEAGRCTFAAGRSLRRENRRLRGRLRQQERENGTLRREVTRLKHEVGRLKSLLEEARRAPKRPAAPFSKGRPKANPRKPGRKAGDAYGKRADRPVPSRIDETVEAPLPNQCPHCGGEVEQTAVEDQYQTDIPERVATRTTRFRVHVGHYSGVVYPDETSWRVNGRLRWLWDFVCASATLYTIRDSRGYDVIEQILGAGYAGVLGHDGWSPYDRLKFAEHQTCNDHLLRRCRELLEVATGRAGWFPRELQALLRAGLALRDRRDEGIISGHGLAVSRGRLEARLDRLLYQTWLTNPDNVRLANHLDAHRHQVFTYLWIPGVEATNWPAEQELGPAVVTRKISAGNRSDQGAQAQEVLISVLRTCARQRRDPLRLLVKLQQAATPQQRPRFRFPLLERNSASDLPAP